MKNEQGICPICGNEDLEYGVFEIYDDNIGFYPVDCPKCKAHFEETHRLTFLENDNITEG